MSYQVTTDFRQGLDARKYFLALPAGALLKCNNAHITQGGEIEKRKAFVPVSGIPAAFSGIHFGLQPASTGIYIFGSYVFPQGAEGSRARSSNVATLIISTGGTRGFQAGDVVNISGVGGTGYNGNGITLLSATSSSGTGTRSQTITYASAGSNEGTTIDSGGTIVLQVAGQLPSPLIYEVLPNPGAGDVGSAPNMTAILSSTLFGEEPFAIAQYSDGTIFPYYGSPETVMLFQGVFVPGAAPAIPDSYVGQELALYGTIDITSGQSLLKQLVEYMDGTLGVPELTNYTNNWTLGATHFDLFSVPTTIDGTPYTVTVSVTSAAGILTATQENTGTAAVAAAQPVGNFQIIAADSGTQATGTILNNSGGNMSAGDTVTIGTITYRFESTLAQAYDVKIGSTRVQTLASFAAAINGTGTVGSDYFAGTLKNTAVLCTGLNNSTGTYSLSLAAIEGGTAGNSIALSSTASTRLVVSGATLSGAVASQVNQIVVNGATNLLSAAVPFTTDLPTTAAAIVTGINSNPGSGYEATSSGASVNIMPIAAGAGDNGFTVQVQSQGTIVCGNGSFSLVGTGFTIDYCQANGVDLMQDVSPFIPPNSSATVLTYPSVPGQVLSDFCRLVANSINSATGTNGYIAICPMGGVSIHLCKATTTSSDAQQVLDVSATPTATNTGSVVPGSLTPLSVTLSADAAVIPLTTNSAPIAAQVAGGQAPYTYKWVPLSNTTVQGTVTVGVTNPKSAQTSFRAFNYKAPARGVGNTGTTGTPVNNQFSFACIVTDALGNQAESEPCSVTVLAIES